jgi:hypothetical protein
MAVTQADTKYLRFATQGDEQEITIDIDTIRWVGASAAGHACIIKDENGDILFDSEANAAYFIDAHSFRGHCYVTKITIDTMNSGRVYVYRR